MDYKYMFTLRDYSYYTLILNSRRYYKRLSDKGDYIPINHVEYANAYWEYQRIRINNGL